MRISDWSSDVCSSDLHNVEKVAEANFESLYGGDWRAITYRNKAVGTETLALVKGRITPDKPTLVRMHTLSIFSDSLGEVSERSGMLQGAMRADIAPRQASTPRSEEHTSELQSLMRNAYAVFCLNKKEQRDRTQPITTSR